MGPTASGKTALACAIAYYFDGEIVSADSRQVYRGLDIGTGKDINEYLLNGKQIPYHLIDITTPDKQFFLHEFQYRLSEVFNDITKRNKLPVICGGTGLYLDALRKDFSLTQVPENPALRAELASKSKTELISTLKLYPAEITQHVDITSMKRIVRGIEIAEYLQTKNISVKKTDLPYHPFYLGLLVPKTENEKKTAARLDQRLKNGLIEEVKTLMDTGLSYERLQFLGLEYKFVSDYLTGKSTLQEMQNLLGIAIRQYAKRQMTWFRKMEKEGLLINWFDPADRKKIFDTLSELFFRRNN